MSEITIYYLNNKIINKIYPIYPRINLNSTFEEPGTHPVFHFIIVIFATELSLK
jgi:hypothetical protein